MTKILFLAANPKTTSLLQLRDEANKIHDSLKKAGAADEFQLIEKWAVDSAALRRTLLDEKPDIVHFSGHGTGAEGLVLEGQDGIPRSATGDALASLFKIVNEIKPVRCVLLNACYAEEQARAIFRHIDNVIGMRREVKDDAAIAFSVGFYDGLARQLPTRTAFDLGCTAIQFELASFSQGTRKAIVVLDEAKEVLEPIPDHLIPILFSRESDAVASTSVQAPSFSEALKEDGIGKEEALKQYREHVKEFLDDRELTPIEEFQLATLASTLGLSEAEVNQIRLEEQHRIEQARENYKKVLTQTINKGFYPLDEKIQAQLKELQKTLDLMDFDVEEISQPILKLAEKDYRAKQLQQAQQEYEQKLQRYEQEFSQAIAAQYLVNEQKNQEHCKSILENLGSQLSTILNCSMVDLSYELDKCLGQFLSSRLK